MHDEEGPRRLRQGADTPEALLRALAALRQGVDDSARLERVGQRMEAVLDAPPTAAAPQLTSPTSHSGLWGNKLNALKLIFGGLALIVPLFFLQHMDEATVPAGDRAGSPQLTEAPQKTQTAPTVEAAAPEQPIAEPVQVASETSRSAEEATAPASRRASRTAHAAAARPRKHRDVAEQTSTQDEEQPTGADADRAAVAAKPVSANDSTSAAQTVNAASAATQPKASATRPSEATQEGPQPSEAELLLKARQALKRDPGLALRWVTEHQKRFVNGRLVPEREVMAIEALRSLGRKKEADERLHKFEERYPNSIHLKRLHEAP